MLRIRLFLVYIVMEYLAKGSLLNLLHVDKKSFGTLQLIMFARDIACGMEYLASKMVRGIIFVPCFWYFMIFKVKNRLK